MKALQAKNNINAARMQDSFNHNLPMSSNAVLHQETWDETNSHHEGSLSMGQYKMGSTKLEVGANTSTNFMNGQQMANQQFKMSMLRSVQ